jgi:hypothetical protein
LILQWKHCGSTGAFAIGPPVADPPGDGVLDPTDRQRCNAALQRPFPSQKPAEILAFFND